MHLFNLDPAADEFEYTPSLDIRDLISLEDVMEDLELGPNGGLIYCFEWAPAPSHLRSGRKLMQARVQVSHGESGLAARGHGRLVRSL